MSKVHLLVTLDLHNYTLYGAKSGMYYGTLTSSAFSADDEVDGSAVSNVPAPKRQSSIPVADIVKLKEAGFDVHEITKLLGKE